MYFYLMSLVMSIFALISTIIVEYKDVIYDEKAFVGIKEVIICLCVSIVLMIIGLMTDNKERE